jgi:ubiquinone/menaquinone biosynthesis C-methylase UbiE
MPDRTYHPWALNNPLRRWLHPPRQTVDRLAPGPGERIVDLGAGVGYYDDELLRRVGPAGRVTLVDIDREALGRFVAGHTDEPRLEVVVSSAASIPGVDSGSQDRVLLSDLLCDVEDKPGVIDEAWRVLRPGGTAFVSFHADPRPNPSHPLRLTPEVWGALRSRRPWTVVSNGGSPRWPWYVLRKSEPHPPNPPPP